MTDPTNDALRAYAATPAPEQHMRGIAGKVSEALAWLEIQRVAPNISNDGQFIGTELADDGEYLTYDDVQFAFGIIRNALAATSASEVSDNG